MPHIGNWLGAIKPALKLADFYEALYFIADYHAMTTNPNTVEIRRDTYTVAATWMALGLDPGKVVFYRQSDIPQIFELCWLLSCFTPKGFMNRAHGYKDITAENIKAGKDPDEGINMGLYSYPVLMAADILMFSSDVVPVGHDQKQHLEFTRDFAARINNFYKTDLFKLPEPRITESTQTIVGLDGRKMSKSYDNTIPLFCSEKELKNIIFKIVTNSQSVEEPKNPDESYVFSLHQLFLDEKEIEDLRTLYQSGGMGWGNAKSLFFEKLNESIKGPREQFGRLMQDRGFLDGVLKKGSERAIKIAAPFMQRIREVTGISVG
jgi:tryptophanyl-tRNA synthetase